MKESFRIHFFYIVAILVAIVICLVTIKWSQIPNLIDYFNFALTVTSITLALLAIIYAFVSNNTFVKNITSLSETSQSIRNNAESLGASTELLKLELTKIPISLNSLERKADDTLVQIDELKKRNIIQSVENGISEMELSTDLVKNIISHNSINGIKFLFIVKYAYKYKTQFILSKVAKELNISNEDYLRGYSIPLTSIGLFKYSINVKGKDFEWIIEKINKYLYDNIEIDLRSYIDTIEHKEIFDNIWADIEKIEKYFSKYPG